MKPVIRLSLTPPFTTELIPTRSGLREWRSQADQHWIADCTFTTFEGAKRFKQCRSMYKAKVLIKAYEWLREMKGLDDAIQRELKKKKSPRSKDYPNKMRLRKRYKAIAQGGIEYRMTYTHEKILHFGYGSTPEKAYKALLFSIECSDEDYVGSVKKEAEWVYAPKDKLPWWKRWFK